MDHVARGRTTLRPTVGPLDDQAALEVDVDGSTDERLVGRELHADGTANVVQAAR